MILRLFRTDTLQILQSCLVIVYIKTFLSNSQFRNFFNFYTETFRTTLSPFLCFSQVQTLLVWPSPPLCRTDRLYKTFFRHCCPVNKKRQNRWKSLFNDLWWVVLSSSYGSPLCVPVGKRFCDTSRYTEYRVVLVLSS